MGWVVNSTPRPIYPQERPGRVRLKPDGTRAETRFRFSPNRTSPFISVGASVQSTTGSRGVRISVSNAGYTMFRGSVRVLVTHSIRQFPLHFSSRASPCAIRFQTHSTHCIGGWVGLRAGLDRCGKSRPPTGIRSSDRPTRSESLYRLSYPGSKQ